MITKEEVVASLHTPPRTWRAYGVMVVVSLVVASVILAVLAVVANDVPWTLSVVVVAAHLAVGALRVAWRRRKN